MTKSLYVVGDIHGQYNMLSDLLERIEFDRNLHTRDSAELVFVGDYVDRGPDSKGVVKLVKKLTEEPPPNFDQVVALMGNHEQMILESETDNDMLNCWLSNGGIQTIESFGGFVSDKLNEIIPSDIFGWMKSLPKFYEVGKCAVAHAGIDNENLPCINHSEESLLWSRKLRLHEHNYYKYTVHGHTPMQSLLITENVAYIDTGAVFGGTLSCLVILDVYNPDHKNFRTIQVRDKNN